MTRSLNSSGSSAGTKQGCSLPPPLRSMIHPWSAWPSPSILDQLPFIPHDPLQWSTWKTFPDLCRLLTSDSLQHSWYWTFFMLSVTHLGSWTQQPCVTCTCYGLWPKQIAAPKLQIHFCGPGRQPLTLPLHLALVIGLNGPSSFLLRQHLMRLVSDDRQLSSPTGPTLPGRTALAHLDRWQDNYWAPFRPASKLLVTWHWMKCTAFQLSDI